MKYNYKCVMSKNGNKMYYKNVRNKWKRITNKVGEKAATGKKMYRMEEEIGDDDFNAFWGEPQEPKSEDYQNPENWSYFKEDDIKKTKEFQDMINYEMSKIRRDSERPPTEKEIVKEVWKRMKEREKFPMFGGMSTDLFDKIGGMLPVDSMDKLERSMVHRTTSPTTGKSTFKRYDLGRQKESVRLHGTYDQQQALKNLHNDVKKLNKEVDKLARDEDTNLLETPRDPGKKVDVEFADYRDKDLITPGGEQEYGRLIYDKLTLQLILEKLKEKYDPGEGSSE